MAFADKYLVKQRLYPDYIEHGVAKDLNLIVTIPCYNEPDLIESLEALWSCDRPSCSVEVLVLVNSGEHSPSSVLERNRECVEESLIWIDKHNDDRLRFHVIHQAQMSVKYAGVGLARKIAMDEAVARFNRIDNPNGIIVGFDADSGCDRSYLVEIEKCFLNNPRANGANIYYEHPLEGDEFPSTIYQAIAQYELYLRYYMLAMRYAGHPHAFHTVGSSFAVKASAYIKQGGMNRRKAGEDFYFLQKIIPLGCFYEIRTSRVIPSPRTSDRVPFGTGKAITAFLKEEILDYKTYNYTAFKSLKVFFDKVDVFFRVDYDTYYNEIVVDLPSPIASFLKEDDFYNVLENINKNCASLKMFRKKFFNAFNAFKVLKYLNYVHESFFCRESVVGSARHLIKDLGWDPDGLYNAKELLELYRKYEREVV